MTASYQFGFQAGLVERKPNDDEHDSAAAGLYQIAGDGGGECCPCAKDQVLGSEVEIGRASCRERVY